MRACLLYLCIFTLVQSFCAQTAFQQRKSQEILSRIIFVCQRELNLKKLDTESKSNKRVDLNSSASGKGDASARSSSSINIRNGGRVLSISNKVDLGRLPKRPSNGKNDQSSVDSSVSVNLGDSLYDNNSLQKLFGNSINKVNGIRVPQPRSAPKKKPSPISISIGDNNANNQVIQEDNQPTPAPTLLSLLGGKVQPRSSGFWGAAAAVPHPNGPSEQKLLDNSYLLAKCIIDKPIFKKLPFL
ncbi:uncharacterized protein LOC124460014 [Drosophila willistoni]|uniref:uncharacterized protein LOC124460014 n=1 Tax=Drosophila willistoni TaxID=7260 RepID=UPI001F07C31A|nr:uncharacterized protein LOC124460014 [Drosophila willistoni]